MDKGFKCPICGVTAKLITVKMANHFKVECAEHGVQQIPFYEDKKNGQRNLFGRGALELFVLLGLYALVLSSMIVMNEPKCPDASSFLCQTLGR